MKIAVIGAGIAGVTAAYFLARSGHEVVVFEKERYPAMKTSYANGGQVSVSNSEVWNTWSNVKKGIKWMLQKDAPLLIRPTFEWRKIKWMSGFLLHTLAGVYARNTAETIRLGIESRQLLETIAKDENIEFDQRQCGILHFYKDKDYFYNAQSVKDLYEANGCEWKILEPNQTKSLDPALENIENIVGGAWTPSDWTGDIHKFCRQLLNVMIEKYNVKFYCDVEVTDLNMLDQYERIVRCQRCRMLSSC